MTVAASCPDENALVRFSTGKLTGADLNGLEAHLDGCGSCRKLVAQLAALKPVSSPMTDTIGPAKARHTRVGRYQVEGLLGGGGMGVVYAARDHELNRAVALKLLRTTTAATPELRARLQREAQAMAKLSHPNLVPVFELGSDGGDDFLAMELIDGPTLDLFLREKKPGWKEILRLFIEAGRGLEAAHNAGIVHRDFKPSNVLIGPDGRARVTDFGLSRPGLAEQAELAGTSLELTRAGTLLGTPAYMAPEQLNGKVADARSDQFSFCVALVEALTGKRPYGGETIQALRTRMLEGRPELEAIGPPALQRTIARGLALFPENRFASMGALLSELSGLLRPPINWKRVAIVGAIALVAGSIPIALKYRPIMIHVAHSYREIKLSPKNRVVLTVPDVTEVKSSNPATVSVSIVDENTIAVTGISVGHSQISTVRSSEFSDYEQALEMNVSVEPENFADGAPIVLTPGAAVSLTVPRTSTVEVADDRVITAKRVDSDEVLLTGARVGTTSISLWDKAGKKVDYAVRIDARVEPIRLTPGARKEIEVIDTVEHQLGRSGILDVKREGDRLTLEALRVGTTTLEVMTKSGHAATYRIEVELPGAYLEGNALHTFPGAFFKTHQLDVVKVETGRAEIATAWLEPKQMIRIDAHAKGTTKLRAYDIKGQLMFIWEVVVGDPPPVATP